MPDANNYYNAGLKYLEGHKPVEAVAKFTKAIELDPDKAEYYVCRAQSIKDAMLGYPDYPDVISDLNHALQLESQNIELLMQMAHVVWLISREMEIEIYNRVLKIEPNHAKAIAYRGNAYYWTKRYIEAIPDLTRTIDNQEKIDSISLSTSYLHRGFAYAAIGNIPYAAIDLDRAIKLGENLGWLLYRPQEITVPVDSIVQWTVDYPNLIEAHLVSGIFLFYQSRYSEAAQAYTRALNLRPDDVDLLRRRSQMFYQNEQFGEASVDQERVFALLPSGSYTSDDYFNIGMIHLKLGHIAETIVAFKKSLDIETDPETKRFLTRELRKLDPSLGHKKAKTKTVLNIDPSLSAEFRPLLEKSFALIKANVQHEFNPRERLKIYEALEGMGIEFGKKVRGWLGILAAKKVLPIFKEGLPEERVPAQLIRYAQRFIEKGNDEKLWGKVNDLHTVSGNLWGFEDEVSNRTMLAGWAAQSAAYEAYGLNRLANALKHVRVFDVPIPFDEGLPTKDLGQLVMVGATEESDENPITDRQLAESGQGDTAPVAAYAYALDEVDEFQPNKLLEFWAWWLGEGISKAWQLALSAPKSDSHK